jgi:hypothetical protein
MKQASLLCDTQCACAACGWWKIISCPRVHRSEQSASRISLLHAQFRANGVWREFHWTGGCFHMRRHFTLVEGWTLVISGKMAATHTELCHVLEGTQIESYITLYRLGMCIRCLAVKVNKCLSASTNVCTSYLCRQSYRRKFLCGSMLKTESNKLMVFV